jgi:hypothetical protein
MKNGLLFTLLILLMVISACAPSVYDQSFNKQENLTWREFPQSKEVVFDAVLKQLQMGTATLLVVDPDLGIITTDWQEETSFRQQILTGGQRNRVNYNIISSPNNTGMTVVKINMSVKQRGDVDGNGVNTWTEQPVTKKTARNVIRPMLDQIEDALRSSSY